MKLILANNTELHPILVTGGPRHVQGASRDTLSFIFPEDTAMADIDAAFSAAACESITIVGDDGSEAIHTGYTIRTELKKAPVEVTEATADTEAVYENRVTVSMAQRTYVESQLAAMQAAVEMLCMADVESE